MKSNVSTEYIGFDNKRVIITTNKIVVSSDLNIVEKYMKDLNNINISNIISPWLLQSKFFLKILGVLYFLKNTNLSIISNIAETVIKDSYIFNSIVLTSWLCIIKASPKSDIAMIWVNIWDSQSGMKAKNLINKYSNSLIGSGNILHSYVIYIAPNARNVIAYINSNITGK